MSIIRNKKFYKEQCLYIYIYIYIYITTLVLGYLVDMI